MRDCRHRTRPLRIRLGSGTLAMILFGATPQAAPAADLSALCDAAAQRAARATGVPVTVLRAISLTETGRRRGGATRPWPWTVNMEGKGLWFPTLQEAIDYVRQSQAAGARSFDIGCFQLNHRWHGKAFASIEAMFDPDAGALYAARFLIALRDELGSWSKAAGAYHSRTPKYAKRYIARFEKFRTALANSVLPTLPRAPQVPDNSVRLATAEPPQPTRVNAYPLLQAGKPAGLGSLVPLGEGRGSLFAPVEPRG